MQANLHGSLLSATAVGRSSFSYCTIIMMQHTGKKIPRHTRPRSPVDLWTNSARMATRKQFQRNSKFWYWRDPKAVWVVAHRGASGHAPENTMAAFRRAVEMGARFIETDLHLTRDARVVAIHDATLDRTTNGKGPIDARSMKEIRALDAGAWFASRANESFAGEPVPT